MNPPDRARSQSGRATWFLGIGAQKAGTTWLSANLRRHPDIWSPVKAFHYFGDSKRPLIVKALSSQGRGPRWRRMAIHGLTRALLRPGESRRTRWLLRFLFRFRTVSGYRRVMMPPAGMIGGEVSASYARLDEGDVARIREVLPEARIIYVLRDPIQRTWSQTAMHFRQRGYPDLAAVPADEVTRFLSSASPHKNSDYLRVLAIWEAHYPPSQLHVDFYERLAEQPAEFLKDAFRFLGLDHSDAVIPPTIGEARNVGRYPPPPPEIARALAQRYLEPCRLYHQRFSNQYTVAWLRICEELAAARR